MPKGKGYKKKPVRKAAKAKGSKALRSRVRAANKPKKATR